jgi:hypothetical protein
VRNTQWIYISKSIDDIQVQYNMHLQEASMPVALKKTLISSKAQEGLQ